MKKFIQITLLILMVAGVGCKDDLLDTTPQDKIDAQTFFNTATDLEVYTNGFYEMLPTTEVYTDDANSDNLIPLIVSDRAKGARILPVARGTGGWNWANLRSINFFLANYEKCPDQTAKSKFGGIARFFRAYFYYEKLKTFGDVPIYDKVLTADDPDLYKARDPRKTVVNFILADLDYAIANIPKEVKLNSITRYTALILKARLCLFEGTFRKYHGLGDSDALLTQAAAAADELITSNAYRLFNTGGANVAYRELFARINQDATETILARDFNPTFGKNTINYGMTSPTFGAYGIPKDFVNSYLLKTGARFTDLPNYATSQYYEEMQNRDPRLTQTVAGPDFAAYGETVREPVNMNITTTGYRIIKALSTRDQWASSSSYFDLILFRYAEALLIYAEAKAELNTLTQADLDKSINKLRERIGMPFLNLTAANASPDPYLLAMYPNVNAGPHKGVILEIRRERRIELFNEGLRWDDLMRWKEGKKMEKPLVGIYFPGLGAYDFNNDGKADVFLHNGNATGAPAGTSSIVNVNQKKLTNNTLGNFDPLKGTAMKFDEDKDYLYPIPVEDINLNPKIIQNPNWK